jgi:hypothetical protein
MQTSPNAQGCEWGIRDATWELPSHRSGATVGRQSSHAAPVVLSAAKGRTPRAKLVFEAVAGSVNGKDVALMEKPVQAGRPAGLSRAPHGSSRHTASAKLSYQASPVAAAQCR